MKKVLKLNSKYGKECAYLENANSSAGVGVVKSSKYGKIFVQIFITK